VWQEDVICIEKGQMAAVASLDCLIAGDGRAAMVVLIQQEGDRSAAEFFEVGLFWWMRGSVIHNHDLIGSPQLTGNRP
jgi:hypothetical protein